MWCLCIWTGDGMQKAFAEQAIANAMATEYINYSKIGAPWKNTLHFCFEFESFSIYEMEIGNRNWHWHTCATRRTTRKWHRSLKWLLDGCDLAALCVGFPQIAAVAAFWWLAPATHEKAKYVGAVRLHFYNTEAGLRKRKAEYSWCRGPFQN